MDIKVTDSDGHGVTEVLFWDGPRDGISTYDYKPEPDFSEGLCSCCLIDPPSVVMIFVSL